jgi:hypothetical protein
MLSAAYIILKKHEPFKELGYDYPDKQKGDVQIQFYIKKLKTLGVSITP